MQIRITATCIRVPVMRAHAESINLEFEKDISEQQALDALAHFPGVSIINDRVKNRWVRARGLGQSGWGYEGE